MKRITVKFRTLVKGGTALLIVLVTLLLLYWVGVLLYNTAEHLLTEGIHPSLDFYCAVGVFLAGVLAIAVACVGEYLWKRDAELSIPWPGRAEQPIPEAKVRDK